MNKTAPFSVLMSLYAQEKEQYLQECFASLRAQTLQADEIVLVLDGPITLPLQEVITRYQHQLPLKIVALHQNLGLGKALNEGIKACTHEWIFRMDTDDICDINRFALQWDYIQKNPNIHFFSAQVAEFNENIHEKTHLKSVPITHHDIMRYVASRNPFNHMAIVYKKVDVLSVGGYQHHLWMEDYNLWLRMLSAGFLSANLPDTVVFARANQAMLNRRRGFRYIKSEWQLFKLKRQLKIQSFISAFAYFVLRSMSRLLPKSLIGVVYKKLRQPLKNKSY